MIEILGVFAIGFVAAYIGAMVGSGGLISIPFLIFMGLPAHIAIATSKFGGLGLTGSALARYAQAGKVRWKMVPPLLLLAVVSALIGAQLLVEIDKEILQKIIGVFIVLMLPTVFIKSRKKTSVRWKGLGYGLYMLAMIWGAFFGGGGGTLIIYIFMNFFGLGLIESTATNKPAWILMSLTSLVIYGLNGFIHWPFAITIFLGMSLGAYLGASTAIRKGEGWVRVLFAIVVIVSAVKLLFF